MEDAMWNCISCELWSAYKMKMKTLVTKVAPVLRRGDKWVRNPLVITDKYIDDGEIVYGEMKKGKDKEGALKEMADLRNDSSLLDKAVDEMVWHFTNLMPGCLIKSIDSVRAKKKFFWDQSKLANRHWLAANMMTEAFLGFNAFNTKKITGSDVIDFVEYRRLLAEGRAFDADLEGKCMKPPKA